MLLLMVFNAWKVSVFGVFLVRIFPQCEKILTIKTPNTDTFHAVIDFSGFVVSQYQPCEHYLRWSQSYKEIMLKSFQRNLFFASCILHWSDKRDQMRLNTKRKTSKEEHLLKYLSISIISTFFISMNLLYDS